MPKAKRPEGYIPGPEHTYTIYTTQYDEIVEAEDLAEPEELERLRAMLDQQLAHLHSITTRLANRLQRKLMAQQQRSWEFDLDEGMLDASVEGEPLDISFNIRYLIEVLRVITEERVVFQSNGAANPGVIRPENRDDFIHVIMPMSVTR